MKNLTITLSLSHDEDDAHPHRYLKERWSAFLARLPMLGYTVESDEWEESDTAEAIAEMGYNELRALAKERGVTLQSPTKDELVAALRG